MAEKFKHFIDVLVPVSSCTLRCPYCYITHHRLFDNKLPTFKYDVQTWKQAFSQDRWGGVCLVNFCAAGETLLAPEMVDYIRVTLEQGHYVMVVTNATIDRSLQKIAQFDKALLKRLFFKFSFHYQQLTERKLLDRFFNNVRMMRDAGASFTLEITPHDELIPHLAEIKAIAVREVGACPHVSIARDEREMSSLPLLTKMSKEDYINTWKVFDSPLFDFKINIWGKKRCEFCYAGQWVHLLNMKNGLLFACYDQPFSQNILDDPLSPIAFHPVGHWCRMPHCFNGHSWLGFGAIEGFPAPTYATMRNRRCTDGTEWLNDEMKQVMETRLWQTNKPLNCMQKLHADAFTFSLLVRNKIRSFKK